MLFNMLMLLFAAASAMLFTAIAVFFALASIDWIVDNVKSIYESVVN